MSNEYYVIIESILDRATPDALHREFKVSNRFASSARILATSDSRVSDDRSRASAVVRIFVFHSHLSAKNPFRQIVFKGGNDDEI